MNSIKNRTNNFIKNKNLTEKNKNIKINYQFNENNINKNSNNNKKINYNKINNYIKNFNNMKNKINLYNSNNLYNTNKHNENYSTKYSNKIIMFKMKIIVISWKKHLNFELFLMVLMKINILWIRRTWKKIQRTLKKIFITFHNNKNDNNNINNVISLFSSQEKKKVHISFDSPPVLSGIKNKLDIIHEEDEDETKYITDFQIKYSRNIDKTKNVLSK